MNRTTNYKLCQWEAEDKVRRTDFNEDNVKIDTALAAVRDRVNSLTAAVHKVAAGHYTGNGAESRTISVGFTPIAVFVCTDSGETYYHAFNDYICYGGLAVTGGPLVIRGMEVLSVQSGGFRIAQKKTRIDPNTFQACSNDKDTPFRYIAVG